MATMIGGTIKQASSIVWQNVLECDILGRNSSQSGKSSLSINTVKTCAPSSLYYQSLGFFYLAAEDFVRPFSARNGI